jgi:DNA-binding MarR family transcriptional regulator
MRPEAHAKANREAPDDALEIMHSVMHAYRSMQYRFLRDGPHTITHMDGKVLAYIGHHPGATQSELAAHSGRDKAQLARLIKGLRSQGLLDAQPNEADRRNLRLFLSAEGQTIRQTLQQQSKNLGAKAVAGLSAEEHQQLLGLLRRVKGNLNPRSGTESR